MEAAERRIMNTTAKPGGKLRGGVAGAGAFGANHAGKYAGEPRATLAAVFDIDLARADALADQHGAAAFADFDAFLDAVDVVTLACPAVTHGTLARRALTAGKAVLVEKPIATTHDEGAAVIAAAKASGKVLALGHQERLVFAAMGLFEAPEKPTLIEARREGPWSGRGADVSVTLDLSIHDADLAMTLLGEAPVSVTAQGRSEKGAFFDAIESEARFASGAVVRLASTRVAAERKRMMRVVYPSGEVRVDFVARTFENATPFALDPDFADKIRDPLGANVSRFLDAVLGVSSRPPVTGEEGLAALDLILAIDRAAS
jgi:predicted dehydrogenase